MRGKSIFCSRWFDKISLSHSNFIRKRVVAYRNIAYAKCVVKSYVKYCNTA